MLALSIAYAVLIRNGPKFARLAQAARDMDQRPALYYLNRWHNRH